MRTNLVLMLAFLLFLVGFFSTQMGITGDYSRSLYTTSLSEEHLAAFGDLTLDDCRVAGILSARASGSPRGVSVATGSSYDKDYPPATKTAYQFSESYDKRLDLNDNGIIDPRDVTICYNSVNERGPVFGGDSRSATRRSTQLNACSPEGERTCRLGPYGHELAACTRDQYGILSWATVTLSGKAQKCINRLGGAILSNRIITKQPTQTSFLFTAPSPS